MNEAIQNVYDQCVRSHERDIEIVRNRLEFVNWLFGVSSALLFAAVVVARTTTPSPCPILLAENIVALLIGGFSFIAIILTFTAKWQGYNSIGNRISMITLLDIQRSVFLKQKPPTGPDDKLVYEFVNANFLPEKYKKQWDECDQYSGRWYSEVIWFIALSAVVGLALFGMLWLLVELAI